MTNQRCGETARPWIQTEKEEVLILCDFYEANFEEVCVFEVAKLILGVEDHERWRALIYDCVAVFGAVDICSFIFNSFLTNDVNCGGCENCSVMMRFFFVCLVKRNEEMTSIVNCDWSFLLLIFEDVFWVWGNIDWTFCDFQFQFQFQLSF
jgi:hypothetical protein